MTVAGLFRTPGGREARMSPTEFVRRALMPYGCWTCESGRVVLFNRFYEPIWQKLPDGSVVEAIATEWVKDISGRQWFYADSDGPEAVKRRKASAALARWRLATPDTAAASRYRIGSGARAA